MSADARIRQTGTDGWSWSGSHDGPKTAACIDHDGAMPLAECLQVIEHCMDRVAMRWEVRSAPDGELFIVGYIA